jgi:hypothetical protein
MNRQEVERLLEIYTFEELILVDDLDEVDVLVILYRNGYLKEPEVKPL